MHDSFIKDENLLKAYNKVWDKIRNIRSDSEPIHSEKYLKTKKKSYNGKTNTNFLL